MKEDEDTYMAVVESKRLMAQILYIWFDETQAFETYASTT